MAKEAGLYRIAQRKESMGICFVGKREFQHFISEVKSKYIFIMIFLFCVHASQRRFQ